MYDYNKPDHSPVSLKTVRIEVLDDAREKIGWGTGFWFTSPDNFVNPPEDYVEDADPRISLVTNFHIVAGKRTTGEWTGGCNHMKRPFFLKVQPSVAVERGTSRENLPSIEIPLFVGELGNFRQAWYSKYQKPAELLTRPAGARYQYLGPDHDGDYPDHVVTDIAVIPMSEASVQEYGLREIAWEWDSRNFSSPNGQRAGVRPTDSVYVLGYPNSVEAFSPTMPIWTTGSVANEVNAGPIERFFIDSRTRPGQSGSPVIFYRPQSYSFGGGLGTNVPEAAALLGIYSGRTDDESDIGSVWWGDEIENIHKNIPNWPS